MTFPLGDGSRRQKRPLWLLLLGAVLVFVPTFLLLRSRSGAQADTPKPIEVTATTLRARGLPMYGDQLSDGLIAYARGDLAGAQRFFEISLSDPSMAARAPENLYYMGRTLIDAGQVAPGEGRLLELVERYPHSPFVGDAYGYFAALAQQQGNQAKLATLYEKIVKGHPTSLAAIGARRGLAKISEQRQDLAGALKAYTGLMLSPVPEDERKAAEAKAIALSARVMTPEPTRGALYHEVKSGDTLGKIARRYKTSAGFLRILNGKSGSTIYLGERLKILAGEFKLVVQKRRFTLTLTYDGMYVKHYLVGLGKHDRTPPGMFTIATKLKNPVWYWNGQRIPFGDPRNLLGTRWMGFANKPGASGFGIHGTKEPETIGKNLSAGCVRMHNRDVEDLFELVPRGTLVEIRP